MLEGLAEQARGDFVVNLVRAAPSGRSCQGLLTPGRRAGRARVGAAVAARAREAERGGIARHRDHPGDLADAGFDPRHASAIARNALWTGITLVMSEPGYHPELPADERAELQRRSQSELPMRPAAMYRGWSSGRRR